MAVLRDISASMFGERSKWASSVVLRLVDGVAREQRLRVGYSEFNDETFRLSLSDADGGSASAKAVAERKSLRKCVYTGEPVSEHADDFSLVQRALARAKAVRERGPEALAGVRGGALPDALTRANKVRDRRQDIAAFAERTLRRRAAEMGATAEGIRCEVQEQFAFRTYVLFTYERLRDVRIVYAPPRSLGNFGGDEDNFEWPRHTADFALLRAYVAPDGSVADYDEANVPFKPDSRLRLCGSGAADGDFVFLLGYPGSTNRYAPSRRLRYSDEVTTPALIRETDHIFTSHTPAIFQIVRMK